MLDVYASVDPQLIIWENYGINLYERIARSLGFWVFSFLFLLFVFWSVTSLENMNQKMAAMAPNVPCDATIEEQKAIDDFGIETLTRRKGDYHCFCKNMAANNGTTVT